MDHYRQSLRIGASVILFALVLRLGSNGFFQPIADFLTKPDIAAFLIYLETGRVVRFSQSSEVKEVFSLESHTPDFAEEQEELILLPSFTPEDGAGISFRYNCSLRPEPEKLITAPLEWDLCSESPSVLILHTHATESYTRSPGETYKESAAFRTLDENYNMISVGDHLAGILKAGGISVLQDDTLHDYPSYSGSYNHARKSISQYLKDYPSIRLILDLHRDASGGATQMRTEATVNGQPSAQLMLVVGTSASGLKHPNWEENLALGLKLQAQCERIAPGIMRYVNLRAQRFNQDLSPGALLIEVGAAGNTHPEALAAVEVLAEAILSLAKGSFSSE